MNTSMQRKLGLSSTAGTLAILLSSCTGTSICVFDSAADGCQLTAEVVMSGSGLVVYRELDNNLTIKITNRFDKEQLSFSITEDNKQIELYKTKNFDIPKDDNYQITLPGAMLGPLKLSHYALHLAGSTDPKRKAEVGDILLKKRPIAYKPPISYKSEADVKSKVPLIEQLGFVGNFVVSLNSGLDTALANVAKQVNLFTLDSGSKMLIKSAMSSYFAKTFPGETLAAFSPANLFLLNQTMMNLFLRRCTGLTPQDENGCPQVDAKDMLPIEANKALVVTPDGKQAIRVDAKGNLRQTAVQATLSWKTVASAVPVSVSGSVKLASGDVNKDGVADLVAVWLDGTKQTGEIFIAQTDGTLVRNAAWSNALQDALTGVPITALAVGDVDTDGYADIVVGRGLELTVLQNFQDQFSAVWQAKLDAAMAGPQIDAVAVGRLVGSDATKSLDIVAASNSGYGADQKNTLYLHAFQAQ